jgi:tetratricopeptide (TPR) repeat protein
MAKKLNTKVAVIGIVLLAMIIMLPVAYFVAIKIRRDPDRALAKAQTYIQAGDYENAETELSRACGGYGKDDEYKIERLFEFAEFHLTQNEYHKPEWNKALGCWNKVVSIDTENIPARLKILDFFYQGANAGSVSLWKKVHEQTSELLEAMSISGQTPDEFVLTAHAKALLTIAQRGATTNRKELLDESVEILNGLIETNPANEEYYQLLSNASLVQGDLDRLSGVMDATQKAEAKALEWLEQGITASEDQATATANLLMFKIQTGMGDPNLIQNIREEIAERSKQIEPNGKLLSVKAFAYENPGGMSVKAEVNQAIDAIQQSHDLEPENAEYAIRLVRLLYRKGSSFNDPDAILDAIEMAKAALLMPTTQDVPGPLRGQQMHYRNLLNTFLANVYLEKAFAAEKTDDSSKDEWIAKAEERIEEIVSYYASAEDNPVVQKFQGMVLLAKGERDKGQALMYKAYEQSKALDEEGRLSRIDPELCVTLAGLMKETGQIGLEKEFLEKAIFNQNRISLQKPSIILQYADLMGRVRSWGTTAKLVNDYQQQYGPNEESVSLQIKAAMGIWQAALIQANREMAAEQFAAAENAQKMAAEQLAIAENTIAGTPSPQHELFTLDLLNTRIAHAARSIEQAASKNETPDDATIGELTSLREKRNALLNKTLQSWADSLTSQTVSLVCYDLLREGRTSEAVDFIDRYLGAHPDAYGLQVLRLRANEKKPLEVPTERLIELQKEVFNGIPDSKKRAMAMSQFYRSQNKFEDAQGVLDTYMQDGEIDGEVLNERFEVAIVSKDVEKAESLLQAIRAENADGYQGVLSIAQVDLLKEDYASAILQLDRCLKEKPLSSVPYFLKSKVYLQEGKTEDAVENARTASSRALTNPLYARNLVSVLFARNTTLGSKVTPEQEAEAERSVRLARALDPTNVSLQSLEAQIMSDRSPDQALLIRQQLLDRNPTVANALMLGNMAMRMARAEFNDAKKTGLIELAGKAYQKALEIDPDNEGAKQSMADYNTLIGKENPEGILGGDKNLLWKYYLRSGQYEQAREILETLYAGNPSDPLVLRGLILTESGVGNRQKIKVYLDALSVLDDPEKETELWILQKYLDSGYPDEAARLLASFKERYPEERTALLIEAWTEMGQGRLEEALSLTNRYLEKDTQNPGAWRLRGRLYRLMNQPANAIKDLQQSKSIQPDPMVRLELASVYNETNQIQAAIGELKQGIDSPQAPVQLRLMLESIYQKNNNQRELENFYLSTLAKFPESTFWMYRAALHYLNQTNYKQAQAILESLWTTGLEQNRPDAMVLNSYLDSLYQDKQYDKALALASSLVDQPLAPMAYAWMGQIQDVLGQKEIAIESFDKALEKAGVNDTIQGFILTKMTDSVGRGAVVQWYENQLSQDSQSLSGHLMAFRLAQEEGAYNKAIEHIDVCLDIIGDNSPAWIGYALKKANTLISAYTKTADTDYLNQSIALFENILVLQPENPSLLNNMAYLLADNNQQFERALGYSRKAHQRDPGNAVFLDTYAYIQCKLGDFAAAEQNLIRAIQIYDVSKTTIPWDLYKHLGMAQEGLQKTAQAIESYQKALNAVDESGKGQAIPEKEKQQMQTIVNRLSQ